MVVHPAGIAEAFHITKFIRGGAIHKFCLLVAVWTSYELTHLDLDPWRWDLKATLLTPLQLTRISCKSSWNVCRQVFLGRPLLLLCQSGTHCIPTFAGLSDSSHSICPASVNLLTLTIFHRSSIPALLINSSSVMWSRHEMPNMVANVQHMWNSCHSLPCISCMDFWRDHSGFVQMYLFRRLF